MTTVLIAGGGTGGHLMPALAIGEAVRQLHPDWTIVYAGAERGIESQVLPARKLPHHLLPMEPLYRRQWWRNARWPFLFWPLIRSIDNLLDLVMPDVVIGTGGYASGPVVWRAARRKIPTGVLDLDVRPGITTRWLARSVDQVWLAAPEAMEQFPERLRARIIVTGAPIVPPEPGRRNAARALFGIHDDRPVLLITGGSQGSLAINNLVADWLRSGGGSGTNLLWATGRATHEQFAEVGSRPGVKLYPFLDPMADAWAVADMVVSRCGMSTLSEICAWGLPSILIPLPTSAADHQTHNARAMADAGASVMLRQEGLQAATLGRTIDDLLHDDSRRATMAAAALRRGRPTAAREIAERVAGLARR